MRSKKKVFGMAAFAVAAIAALGGVVMLLWNAVIPALFVDARSIGYLQALGLLVLCRVLVGGFRGHRGWHGYGRGRWEKWQSMTPEEREQFRQRWSSRARSVDQE